MKTLNSFKMIVLATVFSVGVANSPVKAQENNFITNEEVVDDLVLSKSIYRLDGVLYRYLKYDFEYDEQQRMISKKSFKWDEDSKSWTPYFKIDCSYSDHEVRLDYARWNTLSGDYDKNVERCVYSLDEASKLVAYMDYKWNGCEWIEKNSSNWAMNISTSVSRITDTSTASR